MFDNLLCFILCFIFLFRANPPFPLSHVSDIVISKSRKLERKWNKSKVAISVIHYTSNIYFRKQAGAELCQAQVGFQKVEIVKFLDHRQLKSGQTNQCQNRLNYQVSRKINTYFYNLTLSLFEYGIY